MTYSIVTLRQALKQLGVSKGVNPFAWEDKPSPSAPYAVHPQLAARFRLRFTDRDPAGRTFTREVRTGGTRNFLNDLAEYCWLVYSKSHFAACPQLIGRTKDLWVSEYLEKAGIDLAAKQTLWDPHAHGNIQVMDKWAPTINDAWVLGGVHRRADFQLVSARTLGNLWDFGNPQANSPERHVVTAREVLGLLHFGYKLHRAPNLFTCEGPNAAENATLEDYDRYMKELQAQGSDSIRSILVLDPNLQVAIQNFNPSALRQVPPSR